MLSKAVRKFLEIYAEPESRDEKILNSLAGKNFDHCLVVPAYREDHDLFEMLESLRTASFHKKVLCILVLNGKKKDEVFHTQVLNKLRAQSFTEFELLLVDRATGENCFDEKEGVGLARKIGCDLALALYANGTLLTPWIRTTDADVILPHDYFFNLNDHSVSAFYYPFRHQAVSTELEHAVTLYDRSLHHYIEGLKFAGSPYAFHTIGSTLAFHAESYAEVRGFPKLEAGEDFYLLNKLAKVGRVIDASSTALTIKGRLSDRAPFGTGAAVGKIQKGEPFAFYHPKIFSALKLWLNELNLFADSLDLENFRLSIQQSCEFGEPVLKIADALGLFEQLKFIPLQVGKAEANRRHLHIWFDGFKTLKFLHGLRDAYWPSIPHLEGLSFEEPLSYKNDYANSAAKHL